AFFFNDTATTEIYTLSLHDALPIWAGLRDRHRAAASSMASGIPSRRSQIPDRKSTRLNSSHRCISYAVFCVQTTPFTLTSTAFRKPAMLSPILVGANLAQ